MQRELATRNRAAQVPADGYFGATVTIGFAVALFFGGATGKWSVSDALPVVAACPVLIWGALRLRNLTLPREAQWGLGLFGAIGLVQIVHLLPLPATLWAALPGRAILLEALQESGIEPGWRALSIAPWATLYGLATFVVPAALFVATLTLPQIWRTRLTYTVFVAAAINVALGAAQVAGGEDSALRFFQFTNIHQPVGIFANANHLACFLAIAIPYAIREATRSHQPPALAWMFTGSAILSLAGVAATFSRAGLVLAGVACAAAALTVLTRSGRRIGSRYVVLGLAAIVLAVVVQFGLAGLVARSEIGGTADGRLAMVKGAIAAGAAYAPAGSGFGTTRTAYAVMEPQELLLQTIVNQVHNDYLQLWMEGGIAGVLLGVAFLVWTGFLARRAARSGNLKSLIAPGACLAIILVHSAVDYPLRTLAIQALAAMSLALLIGPPPGHVSDRKDAGGPPRRRVR